MVFIYNILGPPLQPMTEITGIFIPLDCITVIASFCDIFDIAAFTQTCRGMYSPRATLVGSPPICTCVGPIMSVESGPSQWFIAADECDWFRFTSTTTTSIVKFRAAYPCVYSRDILQLREIMDAARLPPRRLWRLLLKMKNECDAVTIQ